MTRVAVMKVDVGDLVARLRSQILVDVDEIRADERRKVGMEIRGWCDHRKDMPVCKRCETIAAWVEK